MHLEKNFQNRIRQLGGSANLWANQLMILNPLDIKDRDWIKENLSWPINYDEIKNLLFFSFKTYI